MIQVHNNQVFPDTRGHGAYDILPAPFDGQVNSSVLQPGAIRGFHYHKEQTDYVFCPKGNMHVILIDSKYRNHETTRNPFTSNYKMEQCFTGKSYTAITNNDKFTDGLTGITKENYVYVDLEVRHYYIGELNPQTLVIPPGVIHGYAAMYGEPASMIYYADKKFNPSDEHRLGWDFLGSSLWENKNG